MSGRMFLAGLSTRERWVLGGGAVIAIALLAHIFWILPTWERMTTLERLIPRKMEEIAAFEKEQVEYKALATRLALLEGQIREGGTPFSFLEAEAEKNHLRRQIAFIRPMAPEEHPPYREVAAEIKMEGVRLAQIVPFLGAVERFPYRIKRLSIKTRFADPSLLDVQLVVSSYEKMGEKRMTSEHPSQTAF